MRRAFAPSLPVAPTVPLSGTDGDDRLAGGPGADEVSGLLGNDVILGGAGADTLQGEQYLDQVSEGGETFVLGNDLIVARGAGTDAMGDSHFSIAVAATDESGVVTLVAGSDVVIGLGSSTSLFGDSIYLEIEAETAGSGDTHLVAGDDLVFGLGSDGALYGDASQVAISQQDSTASALVDLGDDVLVGGGSLYGDAHTAWLHAYDGAAAVSTMLAGDDTIRGRDGDDRIVGDAAHLYLSGNDSGNGTLVFHCGDDLILGGAGNDELTGDVGSFWVDYDIAYATAPRWLDYRAGADTFAFRDAFGSDVITDFDASDILLFEGFGDIGVDDLSITTSRASTEVSLVALGGGTVLLEGVSGIDADSFLFV